MFASEDGKDVFKINNGIQHGSWLDKDEIQLDLEKRGFDFYGLNDVHDSEYGIIVRDLHKENAVINSIGNVVYIDPIIQFISNSKFINLYSNDL